MHVIHPCPPNITINGSMVINVDQELIMGGGCCLFIPLKQYLTTLTQCKLLNYSFLIFCKDIESPFPPCLITQQEQNLRPCGQPLKGHCKNPMHSNLDNLTLPRQRVIAGGRGLPAATQKG